MKKTLFFVALYLIIIYFVYLYHKPILDWINQSEPSQIPIMFLLSTFFGIFPVIPFSVFASIMGSKYGLLTGSFINWFGSISAALIIYLLARYTFSDYFKKYLSKFKGLTKFNELITRNAFMAVLFTRLVPIVPPPVVNIYSGVSKMKLSTYAFATMIGKIPGMFVYAYFGEQLFSSTKELIYGLTFYLLFIALVLFLYRRWYKGIQSIKAK
ncbi:VTT domain-containing protein [Cytobacillus sp. S13-E01]|uniref:TVP38/TMEM64 family protein n=1 Tax=Cytobacillus sp. S13-E01 TaxID=3031326 RepID=UPI0023D84671|nr:VTT domain-containing protein [Cytobacillus sp. S13-E01]MDF0725639.1 VTT domain-containing protein [Cytobacillus sp. S13-E01]